jgi:hypothetical protein
VSLTALGRRIPEVLSNERPVYQPDASCRRTSKQRCHGPRAISGWGGCPASSPTSSSPIGVCPGSGGCGGDRRTPTRDFGVRSPCGGSLLTAQHDGIERTEFRPWAIHTAGSRTTSRHDKATAGHYPGVNLDRSKRPTGSAVFRGPVAPMSQPPDSSGSERASHQELRTGRLCGGECVANRSTSHSSTSWLSSSSGESIVTSNRLATCCGSPRFPRTQHSGLGRDDRGQDVVVVLVRQSHMGQPA